MIRRLNLMVAILWITGQHTQGASPSFPNSASTTEVALPPRELNCEDTQEVGISLNFRKLGLRRLDSGFASSPSVRCLILEDNEIEQLATDALQQLPNLVHLNLARNRLPAGNLSQLKGHEHLRVLILDGNEPVESSVLDLANVFPKLLYLSTRASGIRDVGSLAFAPRLTHLVLSSNDLSRSSLGFLGDSAKGLLLLDLSNTSLAALDASKLSSLRELRLDDNRLQRVCGKSCLHTNGAVILKNARSLRRLSLAGNQLTSLEPDALDDADSLEELDLSRNSIDAVRKASFEGATALRNLSLGNNSLGEMPDLCGSEALRYLSLANNRIERVDNGAFCLMTNLRVVDLSGNRIETIGDEAFAKQTSLEMLDLSNNRLTRLPTTWLAPMTRLRVLRVNDNQLVNLADVGLENVKRETKLERVFVQNNRITVFYTSPLFNVFRAVPGVTIVFREINGTAKAGDRERQCEKCDCDEDNEIPTGSFEI